MLLFTAFTPFFLAAQEYIQVTESEYTGFKAMPVPAFKAEVLRVNKTAFMDSWNAYLEEQGKITVVRTDFDMTIKQVVLKTVSSKPLNVYMHFENMENGTRMFVAFEDTTTGFISPNDPTYGVALHKLVKDRAHVVFLEAKKGDLKAEEEQLEKLEEELGKVISEGDKLTKKISAKNREIEKLNQDIDINKDVLLQVRNNVAKERSKINAMPASTPGETKKASEKELKKQEKQIDQITKSIDKSTTEILELQADVRDLQYDLDKIKQDEKFAQDKVMQQREIVNEIKNLVHDLKD